MLLPSLSLSILNYFSIFFCGCAQLEIEWGFGNASLFEKVLDDFLKLVQARTDLRVMVFQGNGIDKTTDDLISKAKRFSLNQKGDLYLFAGWGWDTEKMHCRVWTT